MGVETLLYEADRWKETLEKSVCRGIAILGFLVTLTAQGQFLDGSLLNLSNLECFHILSWKLLTLISFAPTFLPSDISKFSAWT